MTSYRVEYSPEPLQVKSILFIATSSSNGHHCLEIGLGDAIMDLIGGKPTQPKKTL